MAGLYVGLDVGTQGAKAVVYDAEAQAVVARGARKYDLLATKVPGRAEQHPSTWLEARPAAPGLPRPRPNAPLRCRCRWAVAALHRADCRRSCAAQLCH